MKIDFKKSQQDIRKRWEESMFSRQDGIRAELRQNSSDSLASRSGATEIDLGLKLSYWGKAVLITWPGLEAFELSSGKPINLFDSMVLLYYLHCADGTPLADRWLSFREFPGGAFYHQAFQGYSGDKLAKRFDSEPDSFNHAAEVLGGVRLTNLNEYAWAFQPLPRMRLAAVFWPGDDEFPSRASILFDAASLHYMVIDGLAILGSTLVSKLEKNAL